MRKRWIIPLAVLATVFSLMAFSVACKDDKKTTGGAKPTATVSEVRTPSDGETPSGGETPQAGTTVDVNLTEYIVSPDPESAPAGPITFNASNIGGADHELMVIKTDLAADALPTTDDGSVDEAGDGIEVIDHIPEFAAQGEESLTVELTAGNYVLICNLVQTAASGSIVSHYAEGMTVAFEVTE